MIIFLYFWLCLNNYDQYFKGLWDNSFKRNDSCPCSLSSEMAQAPHLMPGKAPNSLVTLLELIKPVEGGCGKIQNPFVRAELNFCLLCIRWFMMAQGRQGCALHQSRDVFLWGFWSVLGCEGSSTLQALAETASVCTKAQRASEQNNVFCLQHRCAASWQPLLWVFLVAKSWGRAGKEGRGQTTPWGLLLTTTSVSVSPAGI